jgi:hypothetical protein
MMQSAKVIFIGGTILLAMVFVSALARNANISNAVAPHNAAGASAEQCINPEVYSQAVADRLRKLEDRNDVSREELRRAYAIYGDVLGETESGRRVLAEKNLQPPADNFAAAQNTRYDSEAVPAAEPAWSAKIRATLPPWWDQPPAAAR